MSKYFKYFLIFIIFFNCLFGTVQDSFANFRSPTVGPRDRIRNYNTGTEKSIIEYTYSKTNGFACYPDGLKYKEIKEISSSEAGNIAAAVSFELLSNLLLAPILCVATLKAARATVGTDSVSGMLGGLGLLASAFVTSGLERLENMIYDEDDFNIDPHNPTCLPINIASMVSCITMSIIFKIQRLTLKHKVIIIGSINTAVYAIKKAYGASMYGVAQDVYKKLSLCGDNWLTYGSRELQKALDNSINDENVHKIEFKYIKDYFPTKGDFIGSYKYTLNDCFQRKNSNSCNKLFDELNIRNADSIDSCKKILTDLKKQDKETKKSCEQSITDSKIKNIDITNFCKKLSTEPNIQNINIEDFCDEFFTESIVQNTNKIDTLFSTVYKPYREYLYGGKEYAYTGCKDPRTERRYYDGTNDIDSQLYYFRGNEPANFACDRFLISGKQEYVDAYRCCLEASQDLVCISNKNKTYSKRQENYVMCSKNSSAGSCNIKVDTIIPSVEDRNVCEDLENQLNSLKNDENIDTEIYEQINNTYKTYCSSGKTLKEISDEYFKDLDEDIQNFFSDTTSSVITFKINQSTYNENKYCVETYNLCPYNFKLLGGSEDWSKQFMPSYEGGYEVKKEDENCKEDCVYVEDANIKDITTLNKQNNCEFDQDGNRRCTGACFDSTTGKSSSCYNKPANFCQLDRHCVLIPELFEKELQQTAPYIDKACMDFVGSSHNFLNYTTSINAKNTRLFTAPFVECFVETFKNLLLNKAGHTRCAIANEYVDENNECQSGEEYKKGENLDESNYPSPFKKLQKYFHNIVRILLVLSVVFYGFNIVILNKGFSKEEIIKMILTIITVSYFTLSNAWVPHVFNGIYSAMNYFSNLAMEISITDKQNVGYDNNKYSGCYFFKHDEIPNNYSNYKDKEYLAIFDTLDCKLFRYFGFSNEFLSAPPILSYFISGLFSFGLTLILILPLVLVMLSLIFMAIRVSYQFIINSLILTLLLFIAPIMIPMYLFNKTRGYFNSWIKKIQPCIFGTIFTIMSLSLFLLIFDKYFVGDAVFYGTREPIRDVYCGKICKISEGNFYYLSDSNSSEEENKKIEECINGVNGKVIDLSQEAPICATMFNDITTNSGSTLFDFVIDGFAGFPAVYGDAINSFNLFLSMIFLLVIIFIFEQFTEEIGDLNSVFGSTNMNNAKGILPTLKEVLNKATGYMTKMSNKGVDFTTGAYATVRNALGSKNEIGDELKQTAKRFMQHRKIDFGGTIKEQNNVSDNEKIEEFNKRHKQDKEDEK